MRLTLCTSPHLNRSPFFDGRHGYTEEEPLPLAQTFVPMGLLSVAGAVADISATIEIFDINKMINSGIVPLDRDFYARSSEALLSGMPDMIGFMTDCDSFHHVIRFCSSIKSRAPHVAIVLGCVHASYNAHQILRRYSFVDYVVRGEGEVAFGALLQALSGRGTLKDVGNLSYRESGVIRHIPALPLIDDLDTLPWPDLSLVSFEPTDAVWIEIGRGCPFKCNFCVTAPYWNRRHRIKSPDRIISELTLFRDQYGTRDFNFTHDLFTTDRRWVLKFCETMQRANLGITWTCSSRTDTLDEEQLAAMAKAGCRDIYFGVEAGTAGMQTDIDKGLSLDAAKSIITLCHRYNVSTTVGFISGLPNESRESLRGTLREATSYLRMTDTVVHLFGFGPYRGSTNFANIEKELVPEPHFVDLPLDNETAAENRALILSHRDVFARYSRLAQHGEDGFRRLLEVSEEYFPILNAVPFVVDFLDESGVDPYDQLCAWTEWLSSRPGVDNVQIYHSHQGSIGDFLEFVAEYVKELQIGGEFFDEVLKWERLKQFFRSNSPETRLPDEICNTDLNSIIQLNPTTCIDKFHYAPQFNKRDKSEYSTSFALLRRRDGEVNIVRLGSQAMAIIEFAKHGTNLTELNNIFGESCDPEGIPPVSRAASLDDTVSQLATSEVLFFT